MTRLKWTHDREWKSGDYQIFRLGPDNRYAARYKGEVLEPNGCPTLKIAKQRCQDHAWKRDERKQDLLSEMESSSTGSKRAAVSNASLT